jgi:hypothetical protein
MAYRLADAQLALRWRFRRKSLGFSSHGVLIPAKEA